MSLLVDQIIYTSFPKLGFKSLVSQQIPLEIEQAFLQHIVHEHWDAYNPPAANYRAAYLYQLSPRQTLFGWLYNDGKDDIGRAHTPYFLSYYLAERLEKVQLDCILTCLETGPLTSLERQQVPIAPNRLTLPAEGRYQPSRPGVKIPRLIQQQSYQQLQQQQLLQLFIPLVAAEREIFPKNPIELGINKVIDKGIDKGINKTKIKYLLEELASKAIGLRAIALALPEKKLIVAAIGMEEKIALLLVENMLSLTQNTQTELNWQGIEQIAIRAQEGNLILTRCAPALFLLVNAGRAPSGLLEGEINRLVKKLQDHLPAFKLN